MTLCALLLLALPLLASLAYLLAVVIQVDRADSEVERRRQRDTATQVGIVLPQVQVELPVIRLIQRPVTDLLPQSVPTSHHSSARWIGSATSSTSLSHHQPAVQPRWESLN